MKKRILLKTNLLISLVIVAGFLLSAALSYQANYSAALENLQQVSGLTSEGIYYQLTNLLAKPVHISLTMANDTLLKALLEEETARLDDPDYIETVAGYLRAYRDKYDYDAVFLASAATERYYNFDGVDRVLSPEEPEDFWYYDVLVPAQGDHTMNVDNDQVAMADNAVTLFVNCKILREDGTLMGAVGVGVRIDQLQDILRSYEAEFDVNAYLLNHQGGIELSTQYTGYDGVSFFDGAALSDETARSILDWHTDGTALSLWELDGRGQKQSYVVTRFLYEIGWHLVTVGDTQAITRTLSRQLLALALVDLVIAAAIFLILTRVIRSFEGKILGLERANEQHRKTMLEKAAEQVFEEVYEIDVTNSRPANQLTEDYFRRLGAPAGVSLDEALPIIAEKQIKPEFRAGYLATFSPKNVLRAHLRGEETLEYEFLTTADSPDYRWVRITARLIPSERDGTLHMLAYRLDIEEEKRREQKMQELARLDGTTGLLNKVSVQKAIQERLEAEPDRLYAFFILDIDRFKSANDRFGHAFGDSVIRTFSSILRSQFRRDDLVGRIGGDEFAAFLPVPDEAWAARKAAELCAALTGEQVEGDARWSMSASIGVAFAPRDGTAFQQLYQRADEALYATKARGRCGYTIYQVPEKSE